MEIMQAIQMMLIQTHEGKPMMRCVSIINKNDKIAKIERIMINRNEYSINDKIIQQILKTELVIDTQMGKEISLEKNPSCLFQIGLKIRKLRDNEIKPAIDNAISMIDEGKMEGITDKVKAQIKLTTKQNLERSRFYDTLNNWILFCSKHCTRSKYIGDDWALRSIRKIQSQRNDSPNINFEE